MSQQTNRPAPREVSQRNSQHKTLPLTLDRRHGPVRPPALLRDQLLHLLPHRRDRDRRLHRRPILQELLLQRLAPLEKVRVDLLNSSLVGAELVPGEQVQGDSGEGEEDPG